MKITKNFTLEEFEESSTARKNNIDNRVPAGYMVNLYELCRQLQLIRDEYGKPIVVSSGFRCEKLNRIVGGAKNSDHVYAAAADIHSKSDSRADNKELWQVILKMIKEDKLHLRQVINEYNFNWIHISVNHVHNSKKENQVLNITR